MEKITVVTTVSHSSDIRIKYFKDHLNNIIKLDNLEKFNFIYFSEPNSNVMLDLIPSKLNKTIIINNFNFGMYLNHYQAFYYCFDILKLNYILFVEDDIVLKKDAYNLTNFVFSNVKMDDRVLCLMNKHELINRGHGLYPERNLNKLSIFKDLRYFSPWGIGVSNNFWDKHLRSNWSMKTSFDCNTVATYSGKNIIDVISPFVSRSWNVGEYGINYTSDEFKKGNMDVSYCIENDDISPTFYEIV